jgi:hypothetical protein
MANIIQDGSYVLAADTSLGDRSPTGAACPHSEVGFYGQHDAPGRRGFRLGRRRQAQSALYQPRHSDQGNDLVAARRASDAQAW